MRFLQTIIGKTNTPTPSAPTRREGENMTQRMRSKRMLGDGGLMDAPRFSRSANTIERTEARRVRVPDASLSEILEQWTKDEKPARLEVDQAAEAEVVVTPKTEPVEPAKVERVKTRLLGFDAKAGPNLFDVTKPTPKAATTRYPVGWLVITEGPGRGASFTLLTGMSQIGRAEDQAVQLDFGDAAISRNNHAAIVYDIETHSFLMGHGGKANVVRLNDKPLITTETLKTGDTIRIGETSLQLVVFSTPEFNWANTTGLEAGDVADT